MYEYIRGSIADISPANIVIDAGGVGYFITISLNSYSQLSGKKEAKLFLHQVVREDAHLLFGFADQNERELFRNLIAVNGVGASTAIMMLSSLTPDEIRSAVATGNVAVLQGVKGIGAKTAQRIIIDLKDKLGKLHETDQILLSTDNTKQIEALSALVMLGFAKKDAEKVVAKIIREQADASVEVIIKQALKRL